MISIGSHQLETRQQGEALPVVVFDTGLGDSLDRLIPLQERIAGVTRVFTYNRAGYGRSEPGPLPRDSGREAYELRAVLESTALPPPYVLVGHSLGALNVQVFASRHPDLVAGIVLLDPPPLSFLLGEQYTDLKAMADDMTAEWQAIADAGAASGSAQEVAQVEFFRVLASEHRELFGESAKLAAGIATFGDVPLLVVAAGRSNPLFGDIAEEYQRYWIEQSRALSRKSSSGKFLLAEDASHHLYLEAPELVAEGVLSVVQQARARSRVAAEGRGPVRER
jgi:pimeloyl-ACP methyl ester carboxylesterase